jgi:hypothetical protein
MVSGTNYLYCAPYFKEGESYRVNIDTAFQEKYFAVSPEHFKELQVYGERLEKIARERCK